MIRKILTIVGALLILFGASELPFASWWIRAASTMLSSAYLYGFGVLALLLGAVFVLAAIRRIVGLRQLMLVLGVIMLLWGVVLLANQNCVRDLTHAILLDRNRKFQIAAVWVSGIIRMVLGAAILYAVVRPPISSPTPEA